MWALVLLLLVAGVLSGDPGGGLHNRHGLVVIPGLGRADRLNTVIHNIKALKLKTLASGAETPSDQIEWTCVVYIYANRTDRSFWGNVDQLRVLGDHCSIIENPDRKVTENMYLLQPALIRQAYKYIFIVLDDCKIPLDKPLDLNHAVRLMEHNNLTVLSPVIAGANVGGGQKFRNIMQIPAPAGTAGYASSFVEIFAWVMTIPAYTALWELLCPWVNPYAWGYDFWYNGHASATVPGHRMGITNEYTLMHEQDLKIEGLGRTDNTKVEVKWQAVMAQERYYKQHKSIPLHMHRKRFDIANTSWNGAVKGYLHHCP